MRVSVFKYLFAVLKYLSIQINVANIGFKGCHMHNGTYLTLSLTLTITLTLLTLTLGTVV